MSIMSSVVKKISVHIVVLLLVVIAPPLIYDAVSRSSYSEIAGLDMIGGLTYPAYILYWIMRIKNARARFIVCYPVILVTVSALTIAFGERSMPMVVVALPACLGILPLLMAVIAAIKRKAHFAVTCLWAALLALPMGLAMSLLLLYGLGMSAVGNMRY